MSPQPAATITTQERIMLGFAALEGMGFTAAEQANVFNADAATDVELNVIKNYIASAENPDDVALADHLEELVTNAAIIYGGNMETVRVWASQPDKEFGGLSPKQMLVSGDAKKIHEVFLRVNARLSAR